jgi:hypothetical protein
VGVVLALDVHAPGECVDGVLKHQAERALARAPHHHFVALVLLKKVPDDVIVQKRGIAHG